jgi:hypothetical protein
LTDFSQALGRETTTSSKKSTMMKLVSCAAQMPNSILSRSAERWHLFIDRIAILLVGDRANAIDLSPFRL